MLSVIQKLLDLTLANINNVFVYVDDIKIVTEGTKFGHMIKMREVLNILDEAKHI